MTRRRLTRLAVAAIALVSLFAGTPAAVAAESEGAPYTAQNVSPGVSRVVIHLAGRVRESAFSAGTMRIV
jgi:hypothetical protein